MPKSGNQRPDQGKAGAKPAAKAAPTGKTGVRRPGAQPAGGKPGPQNVGPQKAGPQNAAGQNAAVRKPGTVRLWKNHELSTKALFVGGGAIVVVVIVAVVLAVTVGTGNGNQVASAASATSTSVDATSTTDTTADASTTETTTADQATTETTTAEAASSTDTTAASDASSTTTSEETTTTTEPAATTDTADHAADYKTAHPSSESFTASNWAALDAAPDTHLGAAVDVVGKLTAASVVDPDSRYVTWQMAITAADGTEMQVLCRTNMAVDRTLLTSGSSVAVRGVVVGTQAGDSSGAIVYVESVTRAGQ